MTDNKLTVSRRIKNFVWFLLRKINLGGAVQLMLNGALLEDGWYKSYNSKTAIDKNGNPIPWCTYPYIDFISGRLNKEMNVFEYGCGNSTLWYAKHVGNIKAVEHNKNWYEIISKGLPLNAKVVLKENVDVGDYAREVTNGSNRFNIIIIDGVDRNRCAEFSISNLTQDGIIVFDNSDRKDYKEAFEMLKSKGFKRIDFWGPCPIISDKSCTTIFYKHGNCLGV